MKRACSPAMYNESNSSFTSAKPMKLTVKQQLSRYSYSEVNADMEKCLSGDPYVIPILIGSTYIELSVTRGIVAQYNTHERG